MMEYKKSIVSILDDINLDISFNLSDKEPRKPRLAKKEIESIVGSKNNFNINIINGRFDENSSRLPKEVELLGSQKIDNDELKNYLNKLDNNIISMNDGLATLGFTLKCKEGYVGDVCVNYINYFEDSFFNQFRNNYVFEKNCQLNIFERFFSINEPSFPQLNNTISQISLDKNARIKIFSAGSLCNHSQSKNYASSFITQRNNSSFCYFSANLDTYWSQKNTHVLLSEEGAKCNLYSAECLNENQYSEHDISINHNAPHCVSKQIYKGVFDDNSTSSFNSCALVARDAQKTVAIQQNNNMILSDYAMVKSNPQLEIFADDVECAHGSTFGQLDKDALFYLQARGLKKPLAKKMLIHAFLADVFENIENKELKNELLNNVDRKIQSLSESNT